MNRRKVVAILASCGAAIAALAVAIETLGPAIYRHISNRLARPRVPVVDRPLPDARIVVKKGERRLLLYSGDEVVSAYRVGLGFSPTGDKWREGDGRTPEGDFYVCSRHLRSQFYLSLGLSYPTTEDAQRGLRDGLITRQQHDEIMRAIDERRQPPWDTPLGGAILIHGHGSDRDWTLGCIALDNDDIRDLYEQVPLGTTVTILP